MKPVIGMLLILVGLTTGYLTLTGKLPNSGTSTSTLLGNSNNVPNTSNSVPTNNQINNRYRNQNGNTSVTPIVGGTPPSPHGGPFLSNASLPASSTQYATSYMNYRASTMK